jgi:RNA polymerase II-associated protein 1
LIERLLKRANLDHGRGDTGIDLPGDVDSGENNIPTATQEEDVKDAGEDAVPVPRPAGKPVAAEKGVRFEDDDEPKPIDPQPASSTPQPLDTTQPSVHFPSAPAAPELDPSDPDFLESLHAKYFPSLPADPSKLAWMAPIPTHGSVADQDSPYYPNHESLPASALRFDFRGGLLPPRIARAIPATKGLHHHGEAPEAAGYTVPELARLARSAFPAQRCVAFQTLGRLLYRLGRGEWGGQDGEISKGLWRCVEEGKVIETLEAAAAAEGGHQGSRTYAVEAVWLWQKGGGQRWKAA